MKDLAVAPIRVYQRFVSPMFGRRCKYYPTCSQYAITAIKEFGITRGVVLGAWRLMRCNPWSRGGVDHPHDQRIFRT